MMRMSFIVFFFGIAFDGSYEIKKSSTNQPFHWRKKEIAFKVGSDVYQRWGNEGLKIIQKSFLTWEQHLQGKVKFIYRGIHNYKPGAEKEKVDGKNFTLIYIKKDTGSKDLALAHSNWNDDSGELWDVDISINTHFSIEILTNNPTKSSQPTFDLQSILTHEIGHLLGLGHSSHPHAVMQKGQKPSDTSKRSLQQDDLSGLKELLQNYHTSDAPFQTTYKGVGCSTSRHQHTNVLYLLLTGLLLWGFFRRTKLR